MSEFAEINALFKRVDKQSPSSEDVSKFREVLEKYPALSSVTGDLAGQAEKEIIGHAYADQPGRALALHKHCELQRDELGYKSATALERLLIQHIVLCWLRMHLTELRYETAMRDATLTQGAYWEKKLSANQRRYLRSIETLARVRKMNINLQINMAHQQIVTG